MVSHHKRHIYSLNHDYSASEILLKYIIFNQRNIQILRLLSLIYVSFNNISHTTERYWKDGRGHIFLFFVSLFFGFMQPTCLKVMSST